MKPASTWSDLRTKEGFFGLIEDVSMLVIAAVNLLFVIFDWHFTFAFFSHFLQEATPAFFVFYRDEVHPNFLLYDSFFIAIFIVELLVRWLMAIKDRTYAKWWFYPFLHWYDMLGCIPSGGFIWLRLLRIMAILIRLNEMGIIHLRKTYLYKQVYGAYQIFVEEVTDRALIKLVEAIQRQVKRESKESLMADAIKPDQDELAKVLSSQIQRMAGENYHELRKDMKKQIEKVVKDGFKHSEEMKRVEQLPLVGSQITTALEKALSDISVQLVDSIASKLASDEVAGIVKDAINTSIDSFMEENKELKTKPGLDKELHRILKDIVVRALEKLKDDIGKEGKTKRKIPEPEEDTHEE